MKRLSGDIIFSSDELSRDLSRKSVRGGITSIASQAIQFALRIARTVVLARLLTPNDYGLIGMVMVVVLFAQMFKDAGLSMATVQKDSISHEQISTLLWINILISTFLGACVLVCSPLVARFYGRPELTAVTAALSVSFIIGGLMVQHQALLRRHMQFGTLAIIRITEQVITLVVTIVLALFGWRYWALVGGVITTALADTLLTFFFCPWFPGRIKKGTGVRDMLKFGSHITGFNFINYFARNLDNILIGKFIGSDALGLYAKAYQLLMMPISQIRTPINNVATPALCAIRDNRERYQEYYRKTIFLIAFLSMPLVGFLVVFSDNVILLMLGKNWYAASRVFQVLAAAALLQSVATAGRGLPMMSMGFSRRYFYFGLLQSFMTCLGMVVGLHWGVIGVAAGYGVGFCLLIPFTISWCLRGSPVTIRDWLLATYSPLLATIIIVPFLVWIKGYLLQDANVIDLSPYENLKAMIIGAIAGIAIYLFSIMSLPIGRDNLFSITKQLRFNVMGRKVEIIS